MLNLFDRRVTIEAGKIGSPGIRIENLRTIFNIKKTSTSTYNTAHISIYNLNEQSRSLLSNLDLDKADNLLVIKAGYALQQQSVIFVGNIRSALVKIERPNIIMELDSNDGEKAVNQLKIPCDGFVGSYQNGIDAKKVLMDLVKASGIDAHKIDWSRVVSRKYANGFCFFGSGKILLNNLCDYLGLEYSIQNNQLKIFPTGSSDNSKIILLTSATGLIGSPERLNDVNLDTFVMNTKKKKKEKKHVAGWKIKALLQPTIEPGSVVAIRSIEIPTETHFRVVEVTHTGDTHGNDWTTSMNVEAI